MVLSRTRKLLLAMLRSEYLISVDQEWTQLLSFHRFIKWRAALMELSVQELDLKSATEKIPEDGIDPYRKKFVSCDGSIAKIIEQVWSKYTII
jgi:hypothetical protein